MRIALLCALALLVASASCARRAPADRADTPGDATAATIASPDADANGANDAAEPERAPLAGFPLQMDLVGPSDEDGGGAAKTRTSTKLGVVAVPLGAREPRPIMVALHGGSDHPEWACTAWRGITNGYPFVVCPRGVGASDAALGWSSPADTKARVARAIAAVKKIFGATWVREAPVVLLVGFSMGATQAALLAQGDPRTYARVALAESAYAPEPVMTFAGPWGAGGGERALLLCTTKGCEAPYRNAARNVAAHHGRARLNIAGTSEHGMWDEVVRSMRRDWPWLVEGVAGWETYSPPVEDSPLPGKTETFDPR